jgi:hypothetical protein
VISNKVARLLGLTAAACLAACTTVTDGRALTNSSTVTSSGIPATSSTTASSIPHKSPTDKNDGTSFDPCVAYGDEDLRAVGLNPATGEDIDSSLQRGCLWSGAGWRVQVTVLNGSIDRFFNQDLFPGVEPITVEGLNGARYRDEPGDMRSCYIELPSQQATVGIILMVSDAPALKQIPDACTKAVEVATLTARKLPR